MHVEGNQPLAIAIENGHLKLCQQLVAQGAAIFDAPLWPHLFVAMKYGHVEVAKWLVSSYPALQTMKDLDGCLPYDYMMNSDSQEMHNYGLGICTSFDFDCLYCGSLLNEACIFRRLYLVKRVMEQIDPDEFKHLCQKSNQKYSPPLVTAVINCSLECAEALLDAGADIEIRNEHWDSPMITACKYGKIEIANLLIRRGAKLYQTDKDGKLVSAVEAAKDHKPLKNWLEQNVPKSGIKLLTWPGSVA